MYPQFNLHAQLYGAQASSTKHLVRYSPYSRSYFSFRTRKVSPGKSANFLIKIEPSPFLTSCFRTYVPCFLEKSYLLSPLNCSMTATPPAVRGSVCGLEATQSKQNSAFSYYAKRFGLRQVNIA